MIEGAELLNLQGSFSLRRVQFYLERGRQSIVGTEPIKSRHVSMCTLESTQNTQNKSSGESVDNNDNINVGELK